MLRKLIKMLFFVSAVTHTGCSTTQVRERKHERVEVCVPDPRNDSLQCALADQSRLTRPFQSLPLGKYLCFPIDPITKILEDE